MGKNVQVIECSQRRFKVQNDLRDWEIDQNNMPVKVVSEKYWQSLGISVDPLAIPQQKIVVPEGKSLEVYLKEVIAVVTPTVEEGIS